MNTRTLHANVPSFERRHRMALALEYAGVSPEEMANEIGRGITTIRNYLSGRTKPPTAAVKVWALRCGVPYEWIEHGVIDLDGPDGGSTQAGPKSGWFTADRSPAPVLHLAAVA